MYLNLIRHGPKNNDPRAHQTGVEALLDPEKIHEIIAHAAGTLARIPQAYQGTTRIRVETTPIDRAIATGDIEYGVLRLDPRFDVPFPAVNELIGSSGIHPQTGKAVNLSPGWMSTIWAAAKKAEIYKHLQGEHRPLYGWCELGFDNSQANNPQDPGISLREIACRLGTYVYDTLEQSDPHDLVLAIGHSGDIEPFLYLTLEMMAGRDGTSSDALTRHFNTTRGALEPLTGVQFYQIGNDLCLRHFYGVPRSPESVTDVSIGTEIFQEQARWFKEKGKSQTVLEQKLAGGK